MKCNRIIKYLLFALLVFSIQGCVAYSKDTLFHADPNAALAPWEESSEYGSYKFTGEEFHIWVKEIRAHEVLCGYGSCLFPVFPSNCESVKIQENDKVEITAFIYHFDQAAAEKPEAFAAKIKSKNKIRGPINTDVFHTTYDYEKKINKKRVYGDSRYIFQFELGEENLENFTLSFTNQAGEIIATPLTYKLVYEPVKRLIMHMGP